MAAKKRPAPRKRTRVDADAGVKLCMELMADGLWVSGKSHNAVAKLHGVSPATVKDWATSASRVLRISIEADRDEIRARLFTTLERVVSKAMKTTKAVNIQTGERGCSTTRFVPAPSLQAAVQAIDTQARLLGLISTKVDLTSRQSVAHLSKAEHLVELEKLKAEIVAEAERVSKETSA